MSKRAIILLSVIASLAAARCGDDEAAIDACSLINKATSGPEPRCQERESKLDPPEPGFKTTCEQVGAEYLDGACPGDKVLGCVIVDDNAQRVVDWYYPPKTRDDVTAACFGDSTKLVEP